VVFQAQNRETINTTLESCCVLQDHYDDERNKVVFYNTTPDLQDQDQDPDRLFWSETGLVLRPTASDHISGFDSSAQATDHVRTPQHDEGADDRRGQVDRLELATSRRDLLPLLLLLLLLLLLRQTHRGITAVHVRLRG